MSLDTLGSSLPGDQDVSTQVGPVGISRWFAGRYRWNICALLFFATTLNYMDRSALSLLKPVLQDRIHGIGMTDIQYGAIVSVFSLAYALGLLIAGPIIDRVGTKWGYALAVSVWTLAAMAHSVVPLTAVANPLQHTAQAFAAMLKHVPFLANAVWVSKIGNLAGAVIGFGVVRFVLGLGEAGNFPSAIKATAEWFPKKERAFATGIFNSGTNIGATLAPFAVGFLLYHLAWHWTFLGTSIFALIWLVLWLKIYKPPQLDPHLSHSELLYITSDMAEDVEKVRWIQLLPHRQTWAFLLGKVFTDPIWWFFLFWLPGYLNARYGLTVGQMKIPLLVIYNVCTLGSIFGGWLPAKLVSIGWSINRARKTAMLIYALTIVPIIFVNQTRSLWQTVALVSLVMAAHQAWSCNLFTLVSDMFPKRTVASVVGIGACGGSVAMMFFATVVGIILERSHGDYSPIFLVAGSSYLIAIAVIHLFVPKLSPASINNEVRPAIVR